MRQLRHSPLFILRSVFCIALAVMLSFAETVSGAVLYVKADATGAANGSSWTDAYIVRILREAGQQAESTVPVKAVPSASPLVR
jgi:hypothetical protein